MPHALADISALSPLSRQRHRQPSVARAARRAMHHTAAALTADLACGVLRNRPAVAAAIDR
jgi:hypothetical protein